MSQERWGKAERSGVRPYPTCRTWESTFRIHLGAELSGLEPVGTLLGLGSNLILGTDLGRATSQLSPTVRGP
jgi:hypothetical protein